MSDEAYEAYATKCYAFGLKPTKKELLELHEEVCETTVQHKKLINNAKLISVDKAKEFATRAYDMGYKEAMREIAS